MVNLLAGKGFNPNAYLPNFRNQRVGVKARSLILNALGERNLNTGELKSETGLSDGSLRYHLKLLERYRLVRRVKYGGKASYELTGLGQQPITF